MLVHICCSVDSHYFIQRLKEDYPNEKHTGYFYNPNIHPQTEHDLRLLDVRRSCDLLGIELIDESYLYEEWYDRTHTLAEEPEKGKRCQVCFDERLLKTADKAKELGFETFTTTLITSPKKDLEQIHLQGQALADEYALKFVVMDYRKEGGTQKQFTLAKQDQLYKQNYCGCFFALNRQRRFQDIPSEELFIPIGKQIQPGSIQHRLQIYTRRMELEEKKESYKIIKQKIQAYRLLSGVVMQNNIAIPSYILPYSVLKKPTKTRVSIELYNVSHMNKEEILFISLETYNSLAKTTYTSTKQMYFDAPSFESDMNIRQAITNQPYSLSPIIVLDSITAENSYHVSIQSELYVTTHEDLITF